MSCTVNPAVVKDASLGGLERPRKKTLQKKGIRLTPHRRSLEFHIPSPMKATEKTQTNAD
jgi:hypothetical protein